MQIKGVPVMGSFVQVQLHPDASSCPWLRIVSSVWQGFYVDENITYIVVSYNSQYLAWVGVAIL